MGISPKDSPLSTLKASLSVPAEIGWTGAPFEDHKGCMAKVRGLLGSPITIL